MYNFSNLIISLWLRTNDARVSLFQPMVELKTNKLYRTEGFARTLINSQFSSFGFKGRVLEVSDFRVRGSV